MGKQSRERREKRGNAQAPKYGKNLEYVSIGHDQVIDAINRQNTQEILEWGFSDEQMSEFDMAFKSKDANRGDV